MFLQLLNIFKFRTANPLKADVEGAWKRGGVEQSCELFHVFGDGEVFLTLSDPWDDFTPKFEG